jgi:hypothetical protein
MHSVNKIRLLELSNNPNAFEDYPILKELSDTTIDAINKLLLYGIDLESLFSQDGQPIVDRIAFLKFRQITNNLNLSIGKPMLIQELNKAYQDNWDEKYKPYPHIK